MLNIVAGARAPKPCTIPSPPETIEHNSIPGCLWNTLHEKIVCSNDWDKVEKGVLTKAFRKHIHKTLGRVSFDYPNPKNNLRVGHSFAYP